MYDGCDYSEFRTSRLRLGYSKIFEDEEMLRSGRENEGKNFFEV